MALVLSLSSRHHKVIKWLFDDDLGAIVQEEKGPENPCYDTKVQILKILKVVLEKFDNIYRKKIGRPILVNLPTYYVRFSSDHAQPTYLPKIGRH